MAAVVHPCIRFKEEPSQFSMGQTTKSLTCSIVGLYECPRILLSCFRARNSGEGHVVIAKELAKELKKFARFVLKEWTKRAGRDAPDCRLHTQVIDIDVTALFDITAGGTDELSSG